MPFSCRPACHGPRIHLINAATGHDLGSILRQRRSTRGTGMRLSSDGACCCVTSGSFSHGPAEAACDRRCASLRSVLAQVRRRRGERPTLWSCRTIRAPMSSTRGQLGVRRRSLVVHRRGDGRGPGQRRRALSWRRTGALSTSRTAASNTVSKISTAIQQRRGHAFRWAPAGRHRHQSRRQPRLRRERGQPDRLR